MSEIQRAPDKIITIHTSDDDLLIKHFRGKLERASLSTKLQEKADNMDACYQLIRKHVSRLKVIPLMLKLFKDSNGEAISQATAYRIYDDTQRIFGETDIKNQKFWIDIELGEIEDDIRACRAIRDYRSVAALRKLKAEYIINMGSGDASLYEKIQPPEFVIGFFPRSMKVALPKDKELKELVSEKLKKIAEDVEIEE